MRIIWGLLIAAAGTLMVIYGEKIYQAFGAVPFAEKYLGNEGGSRLFYKLLGIVVIVLGFLIMTDLFGALFFSLLGGIFPGARPQ